MKIMNIPFTAVDWNLLEPTEHPGETGTAYWRTLQFGDLRIRQVVYTAGYAADHWCEKGHVLMCLSGELDTELQDGRSYRLTQGMSYQVSDDSAPHRSRTTQGATLFIVD